MLQSILNQYGLFFLIGGVFLILYFITSGQKIKNRYKRNSKMGRGIHAEHVLGNIVLLGVLIIFLAIILGGMHYR